MSKRTSKQKYRPGNRIPGLTELDRAIERGEYVFWNHKPQHPAFIVSMKFKTVRDGLRAGVLFYAVPNTQRGE